MTFLATLAAANAIGVGNTPVDPSLLEKLLGNQVPAISGRALNTDPFMGALGGAGFKSINELFALRLDGEDPTPIKNNEPSTNEIFTPKTAEDGTVTIPVKVDKNSNDVLPWKTVEGKFSTTPVEARIVSGISVPATDSRKLLIASFNSQVGSIQSLYFKVTEDMKNLKFGAIGTEGSYYNLVEFDNNEPLIRQNPDKSTGITPISFPLEKYAGKYVALKLVDSKPESVIGLGEAMSIPVIARPGVLASDGAGLSPTVNFKAPSFQDFLFADKASVFQDVRITNWSEAYPFSTSVGQTDYLINSVVVSMRSKDLWFENIENPSTEKISSLIKSKVFDVLAENNGQNFNNFTKQFLLAEGICEWVRLNVEYDHSFPGSAEDTPSGSSLRATSKWIFSQSNPRALCWGFAVATRDLARASGIKACIVNGCFKNLNTTSDPGRNHSVAAFYLDGCTSPIPADVSTARNETAPLNRGKGIHSFLEFPKGKICEYWVMPRRPEAWELFLSQINSAIPEGNIVVSGDNQGVIKFLVNSRNDWVSTCVPNYYSQLRSEYIRREHLRNGGVISARQVIGQ